MIRNNRGIATVDTLFIIFLVALLAWGGIRIVANINFDRNCEGYLKRAGDANTVKIAKTQLKKAVAYMERTGRTEGFTSILYNTPDEDVGFWYSNISTALKELEILTHKTTPLERSNMLLKLRETLLDNTSSGTSVTVPDGISVYPLNALLAYGALIVFILCVLCLIVRIETN